MWRNLPLNVVALVVFVTFDSVTGKKCIAISQNERVVLQYKQSKKIIKETMRKRNRRKKNPIGNHTMVAYVRSVRRDLHRTYVKIITKFLIFTFTISPLAHIIFPQTHSWLPALSGNHLLPYNTQTHVHHFMSTFSTLAINIFLQ